MILTFRTLRILMDARDEDALRVYQESLDAERAAYVGGDVHVFEWKDDRIVLRVVRCGAQGSRWRVTTAF